VLLACSGCIGCCAGFAARSIVVDLPFLHGLREHGLYDYAILEIDRLKARRNLPPETAITLDFERAVTQLQAARSLVNAASQTRELQRAATELERFAKHIRTVRCGRRLISSAPIWISTRPAPQCPRLTGDADFKRDAAQKKARHLIDLARTIFQSVHDRSKTEYEKFPKTRLDDPKISEERSRPNRATWAHRSLLGGAASRKDSRTSRKIGRRQGHSRAGAKEFDRIIVSYRTQGADCGLCSGRAVASRKWARPPRPWEFTASSRRNRERAISSSSFATTRPRPIWHV